MSERKNHKRHSPEQIIAKLRDLEAMLAGGASIGQVCQKLEVSEQTHHRWRNLDGGMKAADARRLEGLLRNPILAAPIFQDRRNRCG
jgi:transposase-like protein